MSNIVERVRSLEPAWYGAAAALGGLGAAVFKGHRVTAALVGAAAVIAIGLWRQGHPCADCAGKAAAAATAGAAAIAPSSAAIASSTPGAASWDTLFTGAGATAALRTGCPGGCS